MPFSHNELKTITGIQLKSVSRVNKYTLSYRFLNGNVYGCVFAKNRPVSLNWSDYTINKTFSIIFKRLEFKRINEKDRKTLMQAIDHYLNTKICM